MKPEHYKSKNDNDVINFCNDNNIGFVRGNIIKYVARAGKKDNELLDLQKAMECLKREIEFVSKNEETQTISFKAEHYDVIDTSNKFRV